MNCRISLAVSNCKTHPWGSAEPSRAPSHLVRQQFPYERPAAHHTSYMIAQKFQGKDDEPGVKLISYRATKNAREAQGAQVRNDADGATHPRLHQTGWGAQRPGIPVPQKGGEERPRNIVIIKNSWERQKRNATLEK